MLRRPNSRSFADLNETDCLGRVNDLLQALSTRVSSPKQKGTNRNKTCVKEVASSEPTRHAQKTFKINSLDRGPSQSDSSTKQHASPANEARNPSSKFKDV